MALGTRRGFKVFNAVPFRLLYQQEYADGCAVV